MSDVQKRIAAAYLVPVVLMDDVSRAADTARALLAGGVDIMEITLRTDAGLASIETVTKQCPDILVGGGTVLSLEHCKEAIRRGARFIVSPGYDPGIVEYCLSAGVDVFPGCVTPTEITRALAAGLRVLKFFPASVYGGAKAIRALAGPFPQVSFIPTGGVDQSNLADYIIPQVFAVGGGWLCDRKTINAGDYRALTAACEQSVRLVRERR